MPWGVIWKVTKHFWREILITLASLALYTAHNQIKTLKTEAIGWGDAINTLNTALVNNAQAIRECEAINLANAAEDKRVKDANEKALANVSAQAKQAESDIQGFHDAADSYRGADSTCRALDDPLPEPFVSSLRKQTASDRH